MSDADYDEWFCGVIAFYRGLDFFTGGAFTGLSEAECQKRIEGPHPGWYQESYRQAVRHGRPNWLRLRPGSSRQMSSGSGFKTPNGCMERRTFTRPE